MQFYTFGLAKAGSCFAGHLQSASTRGSHREVKTVTRRGLPALSQAADLLKVDVEGAGTELLWRVTKGLLDNCPWFLAEVHAPLELSMVKNEEEIVDWCGKWGYRAYDVAGKMFFETREAMAETNRYRLLFLPDGRRSPARASAFPQSARREAAASWMAAAA